MRCSSRWVVRTSTPPVYATRGSEFKPSKQEPRANVNGRALRAPGGRDRQGGGTAVLPGEPEPAPRGGVPAPGRLARCPHPPHVREPEEADVRERQAAGREPQLHVGVRPPPSREALLGVAPDRRLTAHVD